MSTNIGNNIKATVAGKKLTIEVDLSAKGTPSASGKSDVLATTRGNVTVPGAEGVKLGFNLYRPR